ncbi:MAG: M20 family metallopeptidase [Anaerovoracaceae bacterium]
MNSKILSDINEVDVIKIASSLINIPSHPGIKNQEDEIIQFLASTFQMDDIECYIQKNLPGRPNLIAKIYGASEDHSLMLSGHIDTVKPYDMENPYTADIIDDKLLGRGSCDMKGAVAAMVATMIALKRSGIQLKNSLYFSALADEEDTGTGVNTLVSKGPKASAIIVGEPTNLKIAIGHKGLEWIEIKIFGKKAHGGAIKNGVNAINFAAEIISKIQEYSNSTLSRRTHPILGEATINVGTIKGGDQPSTVPDLCVFQLDRRNLPGETVSQVYDEIESIIKEVQRNNPVFNYTISPVTSEDFGTRIPFCLNENEDIVITSSDVLKEFQLDNSLVSFPAWSDGGRIYEIWQKPCIILGPGNLAVAHSKEEFVDVKDLELARDIYSSIALKYCGVTEL